eukprot:scaffold10593_cov120-Skeletonema_dohrnii-CCMP3373.AAC.2
MGKCSGLKGGGHHRKAIDVADKKRNEKKNRKKEQEAAGKRAIALQEILSGKLGSAHQDCDIYLQVDNSSSATELCRTHFRFEDCSNRRCKFSHEHSIAEALQNVMSGSSNGEDGDDTPPTIPALQCLPGIIGGGARKRRQRSRWKQPSSGNKSEVEDGISSLSLHTPSPLENALLEGSLVNTIVAYLESNEDVVNLALSCRYLHDLVLIGGNGTDIEEGCQDVQRRKQQAKEAKLLERNQALLKSKGVGVSLRYVVSYIDIVNKKNSKKNKNRKSDTARNTRKRPILIYDYENPHVFRAFRESAAGSVDIEN